MYHYLQAVDVSVFGGHFGMFDSYNAQSRFILYIHVHSGELSDRNDIFRLHNIGMEGQDRPRAQEIRSMSVGDIVVVGQKAWMCAFFGWDELTDKALRETLEIATRKAYGQILTDHLPQIREEG